MSDREMREEAAAALEVRRELGPEYEDAVLESFVQRASEMLDRKVDARLAERGAGRPPQKRQAHPHLSLAIWSLIIGFLGSGALTAGAEQGPLSLLILWAGIAAVNFAYAIRNRRE
jgi:hypothetical protein